MHQQLLEAVRAEPYVPFTIRMTDGDAYLVDDPDKLAIAEDGIGAILLPGGGAFELIAIPEIVEIVATPVGVG